MAQKIRKAIFPVGGLGTRFLPATKSMPKEMLPVVNKPLIHYAFEEAKASGIEQFIFVTGRNKNAIANHFDHAYELQNVLSNANKEKELKLARNWLPEAGSIMFTRQQAPLGLGHAVWCARHLIGDEPFAVILADELMRADTPCLKQMIKAYEKTGGNVVGVMDVPRAQTAHYGIVDIDRRFSSPDKCLIKAKALVEKPSPNKAPSTLSILGRYILQPEILTALDKKAKGVGGEIQLTDAISQMKHIYGYRVEGERFDCGSVTGYVTANAAYALADKSIRTQVRHNLKQLLEE